MEIFIHTSQISKVSDEVDYGFPHTHEDTIFLPEGFLCKTPKKVFIHTYSRDDSCMAKNDTT